MKDATIEDSTPAGELEITATVPLMTLVVQAEPKKEYKVLINDKVRSSIIHIQVSMLLESCRGQSRT